MKAVDPQAFDWLKAPDTVALVKALGEDHVRFVGGAVRDSILGREVTDIDLATDLTPDKVVTCCQCRDV